MKTNKLLLIVLFMFSIAGFSQQNFKEKREQIKAMKVAFITTELSLTTDEATKFWPLYNEFDNKQHEIRSQKMKNFMKRSDDGTLDNMSEKEASALLSQMENTEEELFLLRKKFVANLKGVISSIKIIKLKKAEDNFNRKLLQQYRDKGPRK